MANNLSPTNIILSGRISTVQISMDKLQSKLRSIKIEIQFYILDANEIISKWKQLQREMVYWAVSEAALYLRSASIQPAGGATNILKYSFYDFY